MKKVFLVIILAIFFIWLAGPVYGGLVPCGLSVDDPDQPGDQTVPCTLCHFFVMIERWIDGLLFMIVPALAALMIAIGGFMYIFAYVGSAEILPGGGKGGPKLLSQAKKLFASIAIGMVIIYGAWLIINAFFMFIGVADWTGLREGWWQINCQ